MEKQIQNDGIVIADTKQNVVDPALREKELAKWFRSLTARQQISMRSMVCDGKNDLEIANALKSSYDDVREFIIMRKWRDRDLAMAEDKRKDAALAQTWKEALSIKAQDVSLGALELAGKAVEREDSKALANAARGAASLVAIARQAEGMDDKNAAAAAGVNISVFYIPSPVKADAEPVNVTPQETVPAVSDGELF